MLTVMTGGTSGFGSVAAQHLRDSGAELLVGARSGAPGVAALDLADLESVREFAQSVEDRRAGVPIKAVVLNAGLVRSHDRDRTRDGHETTFAVNYLAHYLLLRSLLPALGDGARVVLTTSGTHDPATGASLTTPRHARAGFLAHPDRDPQREVSGKRAGEHAYTASKLCLVLLARFVQARPDILARGISVVAFDPGQVFGTGLARELRAPLRLAWTVMGTPLGAPIRAFSAHQNTRAAAGRSLARLARPIETPSDGRTFISLRRGRLTWAEPSPLARRPDVAEALWADSADLVGLPA